MVTCSFSLTIQELCDFKDSLVYIHSDFPTGHVKRLCLIYGGKKKNFGSQQDVLAARPEDLIFHAFNLSNLGRQRQVNSMNLRLALWT